MKISVNTSQGMLDFDVESSSTIGNLKNEIQRKSGIHSSNQRLFFSNEPLGDGSMLSDYGIREKSTM